MKFFLISDNTDTQMGMRLAGIEGIVVSRPEEVTDALEKAKADKDIGVHDGAADLSFFDVFASGHRNSDVIGAF